ncbi:MAG: hypothetical protein ISR45_07055 [Rhodospirillales bacterium]|nr:hypothetical protein [Rhodospirillales bacterium]
MLKRILGPAATLSVAILLAACTNMTAYEKQVQDWEPVYCYKSIGSVQCYKEPKHSDSRRLVNFYGPAPSEYDKPDEPDYSRPRPPKMINTWVKDPEPIPEAAPQKVHIPTPAPAKAAIVFEPGKEDVSFFDGIRRSLFGKPELANKPTLASAPKATEIPAKRLTLVATPLQPAPTAHPVIPVDSGTL